MQLRAKYGGGREQLGCGGDVMKRWKRTGAGVVSYRRGTKLKESIETRVNNASHRVGREYANWV